MIKAIRGNKPMRKKREKKVMSYEETKSGFAVVRINNSEDFYVSFGKEEEIKWITFRFDDGCEIVTKLFPVALGKIPANATKCIGKQNITRIRELIRDGIVDGKLQRKHIRKMGAIINKENEE